MSNEPLSEVIGLEPIKKQIMFHLDAQKKTGFFENLLLVGGKGTGKTLIARSIGKALLDDRTGFPRRFIEINCADLGSVNELFCSPMGSLVRRGCEATFYFDECEELNRGVSIALLSILEVKSDHKKKTSYNHDGEEFVFDWSKQSFIFSTTNPEKMLEPLVDRLEVINIPAYGQKELKEILAYHLRDLDVQDDALESLASVSRGNPRACVKLARKIKKSALISGQKTVSPKECLQLYRNLSIYPLGLTFSEVQILTTLLKNPNCSLTRLGAITGKNIQMLRRFEEVFLQKRGLIEIRTAAGRNITPAGREYLDSLKKEGYSFEGMEV